MAYRLSKSRVQVGLQCHRCLWWKVHEPDAEELVPDAAQQAIFDSGSQVGEKAREYVPGGVRINRTERGLRGAVEDTQAALASGARVIYEAAFSPDGVFVAVDILERGEGGWNLIEVKSSTRVKEPHLPDVATQVHVLTAAGLEVARAEVMVLNRECVHPNLENLFNRHDVTEQAAAYLPGLPAEIRAQQAMLEGSVPEVAIGEHCRKPYECPFRDRCWPERPEHHISTLYYGDKKARELEGAGCETILDIPEQVPLSAVQARQVRAVAEGALLCEDGLAGALEALPEPVGYLDFETIGLAIPEWPGCRPYDQVPAQFVCYVRGGDFEPREWLARAGSGIDPSWPVGSWRPAGARRCSSPGTPASRGAASTG